MAKTILERIHAVHRELVKLLGNRKAQPAHLQHTSENLHLEAKALLDEIALTHPHEPDAHALHELRHAATELTAAHKAFAGNQDVKGWSHFEAALGPLTEVVEKHPPEGWWGKLRKRFQLHA